MNTLAANVATAVAKHLSNWKSLGLENVFGESVLILAAAQYLKENKGFQIKAEVPACELFPKLGTKPGEVNYDLLATKDSHKIIWEMKFLKKSNDQRIIYDLVKLALPDAASNYQRLFLIACTGENKSKLVVGMDDDQGYAFDFSWRPAQQLLCGWGGLAASTARNTVELTPGSGLPKVKKCLDIRPNLRFQVHREATAKIDSELVMIFSVQPI